MIEGTEDAVWTPAAAECFISGVGGGDIFKTVGGRRHPVFSW
ncbi:MAG: hypothetical protein Q8O43_09960 [Dehalococcoidia bacterium]|nr:hypothetical protein [Dehalococcoidia bacterium]